MTVWNRHVIVDRLQAEEPDLKRRRDVLDALSDVETAADPLSAPGVFPLRGRARKERGPTHVVVLPHGWKAGISYHERVPPTMLDVVRVHSFVREVPWQPDDPL